MNNRHGFTGGKHNNAEVCLGVRSVCSEMNPKKLGYKIAIPLFYGLVVLNVLLFLFNGDKVLSLIAAIVSFCVASFEVFMYFKNRIGKLN